MTLVQTIFDAYGLLALLALALQARGYGGFASVVLGALAAPLILAMSPWIIGAHVRNRRFRASRDQRVLPTEDRG